MSTHRSPKTKAYPGRAQLTLVEHALSPLDHRESLKPNLQFQTQFHYTDANRNRKRAAVSVSALHGLSSSDDLYLWGLLGLALAQPDASSDFYGTPYYCLKQLGILHPGRNGSEEFKQFREAIRRIAGVRYSCTAFYDPLRHEHREVSFGFVSYSLPLSDGGSRAWRFAWDPIFWELCSATAGALRFDLPTYRTLSPAARRLYLVMKKLFWRSTRSPDLDIRELAVNALGFTAASPTKELKRKILSCVQELLEQQLVQFGPEQGSAKDCIAKRGKGVFVLTLHRGPAFDRVSILAKAAPEDSPLYDPLAAIGFDRSSIVRIIARHPAKLIRLWADITLAAVEQGRVTTSPQAFFQYYLGRAAESRATPPDWWREIDRQRRHQEHRQRRDRDEADQSQADKQSFEEYLKGEARDAFDRVMQKLTSDLMQAGRGRQDAETIAHQHTLVHFRNRFQKSRTPSPPTQHDTK